ncbi:MAG: choice-of-anchor J domain-containing protein [Clostridia bacterium]|nr:choice-of-anchor J domain-containing protein [Clostridia bacterium]
MTKKLISIFVAAMMILSIVPAAAFAREAVREPAPATEKALVSWDFETDPAEDGWQFVDEDGDGYNWIWTNETASSGDKSIMSESYRSGGIYLQPDNWAISPEFVVPDEGAELSFFLKNYLLSFPETFSVYVIPADGDPDVIAANESVATDTWVKLTYDISAHSGETVSIAIRHHNSYDNWKFYIDDIKISLPRSSDVIYEANVSGFPEKIFAGMTVGELAEQLYITGDANYELVWTGALDADGYDLDYDIVFEAGETYFLYGDLHPAEGMTFDGDAFLTANGGAIETYPMYTYVMEGGTYAGVFVRYDCIEAPAAGFYFETDPAEEGWVFVDSDGDGNNWYWLYYGVNATMNMAYEGNGLLSSASYSGSALTPDNWAISPEFEVPAVDGTVGMYIGAQDPNWHQEHFAVYVGIGTDVGSYTMLSEELVAEAAYTYYEFDLSEYAGETISIAIRHFNVTDMFRINLDQVEVFGSDEETPIDPIISTVEILGFDLPVFGGNPDHDVSVPEGAHYTLTKVEWHNMGKGIIDPDYEFVAGSYYVVFEFAPEEGYEFAPVYETTMLINGSSELVGAMLFCYSYPTLYHMETANLVVEEPTIGTLGDVDMDGDVDTADALLALRYSMGLIELTEEQLVQTEVDGDGEVTIVDSLLIIRKALELIESFPAEN